MATYADYVQTITDTCANPRIDMPPALTSANYTKSQNVYNMHLYNARLWALMDDAINGYLRISDAPTAVSDLTNDLNFQTDTDVASAISTALGSITGITFSHVAALPASGTVGTIYLVPNNGASGNEFDEYIWDATNSAFEKIGTTDVDLSGYVSFNDLKSKGSATQPIFFDSNGVAQPTQYTLGKSVPSNAVFTDTTYTAGTGIDITGGVISATGTGVTAVAEGTTDGTVSVTVGGTASDVAVHGLGSAAYADTTDFLASNTNLGVTTVAESSSNGKISVTTNGTTADVAVHGLGSAAFVDTTDIASSTHTHNYAGSSSAGGSATSAVRLDDDNVGSATKGVYIDANGQPAAMTYSLEADVPSNAVFTDTTYSAGTGIDITSGTISNDGVRSISTGATNGTISVNTGGTSAEVSVYGLGSAAFADTTDFASSSLTTGVTSVTEGSVNGQISVTTDGTTSQVSVHGLGTAAYTASTDYIAATAKGANSGVAELDATGKVPSSQLPSYVDDVIEGYLHTDGKFYEESAHTTEITGETSKIYVDLSTELVYRYSGSAFVEIAGGIALGETSSTAYRGDRGKTAYDHSQTTTGNPHNVTASDVGLGDVVNTGDSATPVNGGTTKFTTGGAYTELAKKQDVLTQGTNINIATDSGTGNLVISATDTTYTAGTGITIDSSNSNAVGLSSATQASLALADTALQPADIEPITDAMIEALFATT